MSIKMLHDYVLVKATEQETETTAGVYMGEAADKPHTGTVISVGPGRVGEAGNLIYHGIEEGDVVIFSDTALHQPLKGEDGIEYNIMKAEQIFGVQR